MNNINQIYSNYDQETLKEVRKLEGLEYKLFKHRGAHIFDLWCLHTKPFSVAAK